MTISEAEIHMALVTRLQECRSDHAALSREAAQISDRLAAIQLEHESLTSQIEAAEVKVSGSESICSLRLVAHSYVEVHWIAGALRYCIVVAGMRLREGPAHRSALE